MKSTRLKLSAISLIVASTMAVDPISAALAIGNDQPIGTYLLAQGSNSEPPLAPSLLKQAGQKLFNSAQKQVIKNVNDKLQTSDPATTPVDANATTTSLIPVATTKTAPPCRSWVDPRGQTLACLLCIHGLGLQSNSYEFFGNEQSKRGIAVYAIDVRGFGSWMKANGKTKVNFDECLADIKQTLESIRAANPGIPVYVLGESMGGAIALRAASMYPDLVDGLVSSVPAGERFNQGKTSVKVFVNLLTGLNLSNVGGDILNQATKNTKLKSQWKDDPLARLNLTPQELIQFQDFMNSNHEAAKKVIDMPVLFVQGNGDQLVKPEGTWELFNSVAAKDKSFFAVPGEHLIFEEAQTQDPGPRDQNFRVISSWLSTKVGRRHRPGRGDLATRGSGMMGGPLSGGPGRSQGGKMPFINTQGLEVPVQLIDMGQYQSAISELDRVLKIRPNDPNILGLLGKAYYLSGQADQAGTYFRSAMKVGRAGGSQAQAINSYLLDMSRETPLANTTTSVKQSAALLPFAGFGSLGQILTGNNGSGFTGAPSARGRVYAFYAPWAEQCKSLDASMNKIVSMYGDRVDVSKVNIEDPSSDLLINQFKIGPIPTVVFVAPNGQVSSTIIGESTSTNYEKAAQNITR